MDSRANLAQTLLDNQATAVLWLEVGLRLGYLNPAAETLLQLDARKVLGSAVGACLKRGVLYRRVERYVSGALLIGLGLTAAVAGEQRK